MYLAILEGGSFSSAARVLDIDPTTLGRRVDRLEHQLGIQLLHRTTRKLHATPAGELFADQVRALLDQARSIELGISDLTRSPGHGTLRLSLCTSYARARLLPLIGPWLASHPRLMLDLRFEDHPVDLARDGIDVAVQIVPPTGSELIATQLEAYAHVLVASRGWVRRHGLPAHPQELERHTCIALRTERAWTRWPFRRGDERAELRIQPVVQVTDGDALVALAIAGTGITVLPTFLVAGLLRRRELIPLLHDWTLPPGVVYALHARRRRLSAAARDWLAGVQTALAGDPL